MKNPCSRGKQGLWAAIMVGTLVMLLAGGALASSGEEHGPKGWVATDTYRVMNFAVLAIGLFLILRKPVANALGERIKGIREQLSELEEKKTAAEKSLAEYNERLSMLDSEAQQIVAGYVQQGQDAKKRILAEAQEAAAKFEEQAKRNIESEFKQAKLQLQTEVLEKSLAQAEALIKGNITTDDQEKLVDEYLEKVVA